MFSNISTYVFINSKISYLIYLLCFVFFFKYIKYIKNRYIPVLRGMEILSQKYSYVNIFPYVSLRKKEDNFKAFCQTLQGCKNFLGFH